MKRMKKKKKEEEEDEEEDDHNPNSTHIFSMGCAPGEVLNLTVDTSPFATAKSAADALRIAFQVYSQRPCLGACPKAPQLPLRRWLRGSGRCWRIKGSQMDRLWLGASDFFVFEV